MKTRFPSRIARWFRRMKRNPHYITDLFERFDNWCRERKYL